MRGTHAPGGLPSLDVSSGNLKRRGHGFDDRTLALSREIARDLPGPAAYAEAFELEFFGA